MRHLGFLLILLAFCGDLPAQQARPVYSSIQNCPQIARVVLAERTIVGSASERLTRCEGPAGYRLIVVDQDPRSWLAVEVGGRAYSLYGPMVQFFTLGHFPDISPTRVVEWRLDAGGTPTALIVRVHYQDPDAPATSPSARKSTLMVFGLAGLPPRHLGSVADNDAARRLADAE